MDSKYWQWFEVQLDDATSKARLAAGLAVVMGLAVAGFMVWLATKMAQMVLFN